MNLASGMDVDRALRALQQEARELWVPGTIPRIPYHPSALVFLREYVALNSPVILTDCPCPSWPDEYLLSAIGEDEIVVNRTPKGFGDHADDSGMFVKPWQTKQSFSSLLRELNQRHQCDSAAMPTGKEPTNLGLPGIPYYSAQSDCLRKRHAELLNDLPPLTFACAAFGGEPDAVNLWVGDERSFTATHKDHYENLYMVVRGMKRFYLRPPCDAGMLPERNLRAATYAPVKGGLGGRGADLHAVADSPAASVRWVAHDKGDARGGEANFGANGTAALVADVAPGEMLYLPALWYHAVGQRGVTVAVNWWFDMSFCGPTYVYYNFLRRLTEHDEQ